jgi:hypothetical protein
MKSPEHAVDDFGPYAGHAGALVVDFEAGLWANQPQNLRLEPLRGPHKGRSCRQHPPGSSSTLWEPGEINCFCVGAPLSHRQERVPLGRGCDVSRATLANAAFHGADELFIDALMD